MPSGGNSRFRGYPARMSERQQLALLLQMTSQDSVSSSGLVGSKADNVSSRPSALQSQRSAKNRWTNRNGDSTIDSRTIPKDDLRARLKANGYSPSTGEYNVFEGSRSSPETGSCTEQYEDEREHNCQPRDYKDGTTSVSPLNAAAAATTIAEDSGALCEMRRTSPQNKLDRSGTGQSGSSPRVTLRLNQVRNTRDDKKSGTGASRQSVSSATSQMEGSMKTSASSVASAASLSSAVTSSVNSGPNLTSNAGPVAGATVSGGTGGTSANSTTSDASDVYEFKSSKEATPVRGASSSPNPDKDKEKDKENAKSSLLGNQANGSAPSTGNTAITSPSETITTTSATLTIPGGNDSHPGIGSPSAKRSYEGDNADEQEEEIRRKKRKDSEATKDSSGKGPGTGRQNVGRNAAGANDKCTKSGKQNSGGGVSLKNNQSAGSSSVDRKSPGTITAASGSPKPQNSSSGSGTNSKTATPAPPESDGEDDRPKSSDSASAPKVPPLKIVIPQSTTSEQEVGARNGKNTSNRSHQLPYVVPSSNSNDSTDKDQGLTASGTTSPTEPGNNTKAEEKKDFTGVLHGEERSTHHQRVLRSSHRSGNGGNGSSGTKDGVGGGGANGNYANSSPLPGTSSTDRSNNSSPQQLQQQPLQIQQQQQQQLQAAPQQQQQLQAQHNSPSPETTNAESGKATATDSSSGNSGGSGNSSSGGGASNSSGGANVAKTGGTSEKTDKNAEVNGKSPKDASDATETTSSSSASTTATNSTSNAPPVELHPRKRKMKPNKEAQQAAATASANEASEATNAGPEVHPHDQPITNCYQLFLNIRKQIERRRKGLFPVQPKPPQGFKDYLMNRCTYVLAGNANKEPNINPPSALQALMKDLYGEQEKERYRLRMQHVVEKEKLVLSVEQEILRVHGRAARALANQSLPFSVCTILKDEEVYNVITPEQEEKDRNARSRYNGRLFLSWLQDVDDKWEKIKEAMLLRHHNEAESLHAVQRMDWEWKLKEVGLCEFKVTPQIEDLHVPMVHVSDDFDLLPA